MSFYNPYSPKIQWGQGFGDIANQIAQILMIKKMFGNQGQQETLGQTPLPGNAMGGSVMGAGPAMMGGAPSSMQGPQYGMDPEKQKILALLQQMFGGGGGMGGPGGMMGGMMGGGLR